MISKKALLEKLKTIPDPELGINIVDLGLIYDLRIKGSSLEVDFTLTYPGCPLAPMIEGRIKEVLAEFKEIKKTKVNLVFNPPWTKDRLSEEAKIELSLLR